MLPRDLDRLKEKLKVLINQNLRIPSVYFKKNEVTGTVMVLGEVTPTQKEHVETVLEIFKDTCSGLTLDRPSLTVLRQKAKDREVDAVIIYSPDRLSRKGEDILLLAKEFKIEGVKLLFVKEQWDDTHNGKLVAFMLGWASEFEASQIRERTMRGKKQHAEMGEIPSGYGRFSYWGLQYIITGPDP